MSLSCRPMRRVKEVKGKKDYIEDYFTDMSEGVKIIISFPINHSVVERKTFTVSESFNKVCSQKEIKFSGLYRCNGN